MRQSLLHQQSPPMNDKILNDIDRRMRDVFAQSPAADLEKNVRALISSFLAKLDLVTREEFDIQRQVLLRTREKLAQLEAQVRELEGKLGPTAIQPPSGVDGPA
jgi:BMFP domain-containing protein YqiC